MTWHSAHYYKRFSKMTLAYFLILSVLVVGQTRAFPANISEEAGLRYIEKVYNADDNMLVLKKINQITGNDTEAELNMLLPYNNFKSLGSLKCTACKLTMKYALWKFRKPDGTYDGLPEFVGSACKHLQIETPAVCDGTITTYKEVVLILLHELQLSAEQVCGLILPTTCYAPDLPWNKINWNVTIPGVLPKKLTVPQNLNHGASTLHVLHLSDIHIDRNYMPGMPIDCSEPLCCRKTSKMKTGDRLSGFWGSLGYCDTPQWTLEDLLKHVSNNRYDYIYWTGDLPAHNDWHQSKDDQVTALYNLTSLLMKYFPKTPIYPSLGNHESFPVNNFPPKYVNGSQSISWLYDALKKAWSPWLPSDALETVEQSGYYTTLVRPKFRIISLNMNYCNQQNWWMLINPVDPNHELQWLVDVLSKAEQSEEKVHILGHIPPGSPDCLPIWSHNYYKIVNRFKNTIVSQFFGHTHADQIEIFYDEKTKKIPTNMAFIAPSVTTFFYLHPGYREYTMDGLYEGSTWSVLDHSTFILNLTKANKLQPGQKTTWDFLYSAKETYGLPDLSTQSWNNLVNSWISGKDEKSEASFQKYYYYYYKGNPPQPKCDSDCKKSMLCGIRSARSGDSADFCTDL